jgi:hypothetical protein
MKRNREKLRKILKAMYLLKDEIREKKETDGVFKNASKKKILKNLNLIIDKGLEELYPI